MKTTFSGAEIKSVRVLTLGIVNYNFEIILTNPDIQLHLRVYSGEDAEYRAKKEKFVYNLIRKQTDIPIPETYILDTSRTVTNEIFALQSSLPGVNLETVCNGLNPGEQRGIALQTGKCLGQLHTIRFSRFGEQIFEDAVGDESTWSRFFLGFISKNVGWCEKQGTISGSLVDALRKHVSRWQWLLPEDQPAVLVHRDFHPGNVKVQRNQHEDWIISGVYDFEHAITGHNEYDFAKPYWAFFEPYPQMREPMLLGYNRVIKLSPLFELRMSKLYSLAEIFDFLVFGTKNRMNPEISRNLSSVREILEEDL